MVVYYFLTTDTLEPIYFDSKNPPFKIIMIDNNGNKWTEPNYNCCGIFGGKDIFLLIAEMNAPFICDPKFRVSREEGLRLFTERKYNNAIFPNLYRYYNDSVEWINCILYSHKDDLKYDY
jgi:hypothetical protein